MGDYCLKHSGVIARLDGHDKENTEQWERIDKVSEKQDRIFNRINVILGGIVVAVILLLINIGLANGATQTINTLPSANATMISDMQTFLQDEEPARATGIGTRVVSGGIGATDASLTHTISTIVGYVEGYYVTDAAVSRTYIASKDTFVLLRYDDSNTIAITGATITYDGNFIYAQMANSTAPPNAPAGTLLLFEAVTDGSSITTINDYRSGGIVFLSDPTFADGTDGKLADAVATLGSLPVEVWVDVDDNVLDDTTTPITMQLGFIKGALITPASGKTLTTYSPEHIIAGPRQQIIDMTNNSTDPLVFTQPGIAPAEWWGAVGDWNGTTGTVDIAAIQALLDSKAGMTWKMNVAGYNIGTTSLEITSSGTKILGENPDWGTLGGSEIRYNGTDVAIKNTDTNVKREIRLENFLVRLDTETGSHGIDMKYISYSTLHNIFFRLSENDQVGLYMEGDAASSPYYNRISNLYGAVAGGATGCIGIQLTGPDLTSASNNGPNGNMFTSLGRFSSFDKTILIEAGNGNSINGIQSESVITSHIELGHTTAAVTTTVDSVTNSFTIDAGSPGWTPDAYINDIVKVTTGGNDYYYLIADNDADELILYENMDPVPSPADAINIYKTKVIGNRITGLRAEGGSPTYGLLINPGALQTKFHSADIGSVGGYGQTVSSVIYDPESIIERDIIAFQFYHPDVAASETSTQMWTLGAIAVADVFMPTDAEIVAIEVHMDTVVTDGLITVVPTANGVALTAPSIKLDDGTVPYPTQHNFKSIPHGTQKMGSKFRRLGAEFTTDGDFKPDGTPDILVTIWVRPL